MKKQQINYSHLKEVFHQAISGIPNEVLELEKNLPNAEWEADPLRAMKTREILNRYSEKLLFYVERHCDKQRQPITKKASNQ